MFILKLYLKLYCTFWVLQNRVAMHMNTSGTFCNSFVGKVGKKSTLFKNRSFLFLKHDIKLFPTESRNAK